MGSIYTNTYNEKDSHVPPYDAKRV